MSSRNLMASLRALVAASSHLASVLILMSRSVSVTSICEAVRFKFSNSSSCSFRNSRALSIYSCFRYRTFLSKGLTSNLNSKPTSSSLGFVSFLKMSAFSSSFYFDAFLILLKKCMSSLSSARNSRLEFSTMSVISSCKE